MTKRLTPGRLSVNEVAELVHVSPSSVARLTAAGLIPGSRKGSGNWVYPEKPIRELSKVLRRELRGYELTKGERLLASGQVGKLFHVDNQVVDRWAKAERLPFVETPGGHKRFPEEAIKKAVRKSREPLSGLKLPEDEVYLQPGKAAELFGAHPSRVWSWAAAGKLPHITTPSGQLLYPRSVVRRLAGVQDDKKVSLIGLAAVAARLRISPRQVSSLARANLLPHRTTPGGHRHYPEEDIENLARKLERALQGWQLAEDEVFLSSAEAARWLGVSRATVSRWYLPHIRTPRGHRRYPLSAIEHKRRELDQN